MTTTIADRFTARDDTVLARVRSMGGLWSVVHLAGRGTNAAEPLAAVMTPRRMRGLIGQVAEARGCRRSVVAEVAFDTLIWAVSAPTLATFVAFGVGLSPSPEDVSIRLDDDGTPTAVLVGDGSVAVLYGIEDESSTTRFLLAPWVGQQLDRAIGQVITAIREATGTGFERWRAATGAHLEPIRRGIEAAFPSGVAVLDEVWDHLVFAGVPDEEDLHLAS